MRQVAIPFPASVTVALITTRIRDLPTEVVVDERHGLEHESGVNCDTLLTVPKRARDHYRGSLGPPELRGLKEALVLALELDV